MYRNWIMQNSNMIIFYIYIYIYIYYNIIIYDNIDIRYTFYYKKGGAKILTQHKHVFYLLYSRNSKPGWNYNLINDKTYFGQFRY